MSKVFLDYDQKALDDQYEQRVWVPHADAIIKRYGLASDEVRRRIGEPRTERYGASPIETLDIYGEGRKALVFIHGGAWKRQSKRENAFAAEAVIAAGAAYVALDFALLPTVTLPEMVAQVCRGIGWVHEHLSKEIVSGIYDLLPVRLSARNDYVRVDEKLEHEYSPIRHIGRIRCPVTVAWAEHEAAEFARQSQAFAERLNAPTIVGRNQNHFEIIETLADPKSPLGAAAVAMLR